MGIAWTFLARDKDGNVVEAAPGQPKFYCKGPTTRPDMIRSAHILLNNKRLDAVRFGFEDPGYRLDESTLVSVQEPDHDLGAGPLPDLPGVAVGGPGLVPLNLPLDAAVNAEHDKLIAEEEAKGNG